MLPVHTGDVYTGMARFVSYNHIFRKVIFISNDPDIEIKGAFAAYEAFDAFGFVKICGQSCGRYADVILFQDEPLGTTQPFS